MNADARRHMTPMSFFQRGDATRRLFHITQAAIQEQFRLVWMPRLAARYLQVMRRRVRVHAAALRSEVWQPAKRRRMHNEVQR